MVTKIPAINCLKKYLSDFTFHSKILEKGFSFIFCIVSPTDHPKLENI